jgi:hypothetical protein
LASAKANSALSDMTLQRGQSLITSRAISQQDLDQRAADSSNKQGLVRAAQANLDRLRVLEIPFAVITERTALRHVLLMRRLPPRTTRAA